MRSHARTAKRGRIERRLRRVLELALQKLGIRRATASVFLVGSDDLRRLKAKYYKKNKQGAADVLAFPEPRDFPHPESKKRFLGEIYLNNNLLSDPERMGFLLIHGLLHVLGYSHDTKRDTLKMQSLEKKLLGKISRSYRF